MLESKGTFLSVYRQDSEFVRNLVTIDLKTYFPERVLKEYLKATYSNTTGSQEESKGAWNTLRRQKKKI